MLQKINDISTFGLQPDLTFFLDISPEDALIRKFSEKSLPLAFENNEMDRMESSGLSFYQRVREGYLKLAIAEKKRFVLFDACSDPDTIHAQITQKVNACSTPL